MDWLQLALAHFNIGISQWYKWKDTNAEMVYSNLVLINDEATMPTEEEVNAKIAELQWEQNRKSGYPAFGEQFDMLFHAIDGDETLKIQFADFYTALKEVKDNNPKP